MADPTALTLRFAAMVAAVSVLGISAAFAVTELATYHFFYLAEQIALAF